jgi:hypothetical protein
VDLKRCMHRVEVAMHGQSFLKCDANPHGLLCRGCKGFAHDGICEHVLAITHIMEQEKPADSRDEKLNLNLSMVPLTRHDEDTPSHKKRKNRRQAKGAAAAAEREAKRLNRSKQGGKSKQGGGGKATTGKGKATKKTATPMKKVRRTATKQTEPTKAATTSPYGRSRFSKIHEPTDAERHVRQMRKLREDDTEIRGDERDHTALDDFLLRFFANDMQGTTTPEAPKRPRVKGAIPKGKKRKGATLTTNRHDDSVGLGLPPLLPTGQAELSDQQS